MIALSDVLLCLPSSADAFAKATGPATGRLTRGDKFTGRIAEVEIVGPIDELTGFASQAKVQEATLAPNVEEIILLIDSPGGLASASFPVAEAVREAAQRKRVTAYVQGMAASGAYLIASQAHEVVASDWSTVGSIGTFTVLADSSEAARRAGLKFTLVASGKFKGVPAPGVEISDEFKGEAQRVVNSINRLFLSAVAKGRAIGMKTLVEEIATGTVWIGAEAIERRLVDRIEAFTPFWERVEQRRAVPVAAGLPKPAGPIEPFSGLTGGAAAAKYRSLTGGLDWSTSKWTEDPVKRREIDAKYPKLAQAAKAHEREEHRKDQARRMSGMV